MLFKPFFMEIFTNLIESVRHNILFLKYIWWFHRKVVPLHLYWRGMKSVKTIPGDCSGPFFSI